MGDAVTLTTPQDQVMFSINFAAKSSYIHKYLSIKMFQKSKNKVCNIVIFIG